MLCDWVYDWQKIHNATSSKSFKQMNHIRYQLYEAEFVNLKLNIGNKWLLDSFFHNTLNFEYLNIATVFSNVMVTLTNLTNPKPTTYCFLCQEKCLKLLVFRRKRTNRIQWVLKIAGKMSRRSQQTIFYSVFAAKCKKHEKREIAFLKEKFRCSEMMYLRSKTQCW